MENLNAKQIKKELEGLANFYTCPEYIKNALALITSQEQRIGAQDMTISELRKRVEKAEHDADRYARRIKELTAKVAKLEEECDLRGDMWCKLNEENKRLTEKSKNFEQAYDCMHSACLELSEKCDKLTEGNERLKDLIKELQEYNEAWVKNNSELRTENERLGRICESYALQYGTARDKEVFLEKERADTVKQLSKKLINHFDECGAFTDMETDFIALEIDNVAEEFLRGR